MNSQIINEQRKRRIASSLAEGAQEAILDVPNRKPPVLTEPFHPPALGRRPQASNASTSRRRPGTN